VAYNERRRKGEFSKNKENKKTTRKTEEELA
jgi:hypothetical protein